MIEELVFFFLSFFFFPVDEWSLTRGKAAHDFIL